MDRRLTSSEKKVHSKNNSPRHKDEAIRISLRFIGTLALYVLFVVLHSIVANLNAPEPQNLSRHESRGLAPEAKSFTDPVIQVYAARTWGVKGNFAVHTWLAFKEEFADNYEVIQVIGWRQQGNGNVVFQDRTIADKTWYGNEPMLLLDIKGAKAGELIPEVKKAINSYPWWNEYVVYPGPNSNTFVSWIGEQVPALELDLPATAIGKDWRPLDQSLRKSTSGTGITASFLGLLGVQVGIAEGLEVNVLGLHIEADPFDLTAGLPLLGTISIWWVILFLGTRYFLMKVLRRNNLNYIRL